MRRIVRVVLFILCSVGLTLVFGAEKGSAASNVISRQYVTVMGETIEMERYCTNYDWYGRCTSIVDEMDLYNQLLQETSPGRRNIPSVRWAAAGKASRSNTSSAGWNFCSLWLGEQHSTPIDVNPYPEDPTRYLVNVYGMCTNGTNKASRIWVMDPGLDWTQESQNTVTWVSDVSSYTRGDWTQWNLPEGKMTLDLAAMIDDPKTTREVRGDEVIYRRDVALWRRNGAYSSCSAIAGACSSNPQTIEIHIHSKFLARSNVSIGPSANSVSSWKSTNVTAPIGSPAPVTSTGLKVNDIRWVTFSHNIYSVVETSRMSNGTMAPTADWEVRTVVSNSSGMEISTSRQGPISGTSSFTYGRESGFFVGGPRMVEVAGGDLYISRNVNKITFRAVGEYTICEQMWIKGVQYTNACARITVGEDNPTDGETCEDWAPADYLNGWTSVVTKVRNNRISSTFSGSINGSDGLVYARPDDVIEWKSCYYPGAQRNALTDVAKVSQIGFDGHGSESIRQDTANTRYHFDYLLNYMSSGVYKWTNDYKLSTTSPFGFNNNNLLAPTNDSTIDKTLSNGESAIVPIYNNLTIQRGLNRKGVPDVGKMYDDLISTNGTPIYSNVTDDGNHAYWPVYYGGPCCCCSSNGSSGCTCCGQCVEYHKHTNNYTIGEFQNGERKSQAFVRVPYNFNNSAGVSVASAFTQPVYAGETIKVTDTWVKVGAKDNSATQDTYTTRVHDAEVRLIAYVTTREYIYASERTVGGSGKSDDVCSFISESKQCNTDNESGTMVLNPDGHLNNDGSSDGTTHANVFNGKTFSSGDGVSYNVFDASAGDYMCFVLSVYPYTSGDDTNWDDSAGDHQWYISKPSCRIIAKRPSVQILGSDLFTNGSINTYTSEKQQLYNVNGYGYEATSRSTVVMNGSWVEEGVLANGTVRGLSSGASLGYAAWDSRVLYGAKNWTTLCNGRAPLSFANANSDAISGICMEDGSGTQATGLMGITPVTINRGALAEYWGEGEDLGAWIYLSGDEGNVASATGRNIKVYSHDGNVTVTGGSIPTDTMRIVKASETVTISGNIEYAGGSVSSPGSIPKVVIYAKNINIECAVTRIDAILIAEGVLNTCTDPDSGRYWEHGGSAIPLADRSVEVNNPGYAVPLTINGAVIANRLELPRTYGAATGNDSGLAAETINYDTSMLLWGRYMAGSAESDTMTVTYQHELAPRY